MMRLPFNVCLNVIKVYQKTLGGPPRHCGKNPLLLLRFHKTAPE